MTAKEEIKRQLNHLRNYEDLTYEALRTLKIIEDKLALMEVEIKEQAIADHEANDAIPFAVWLSGHDEKIIRQRYNDWKKYIK